MASAATTCRRVLAGMSFLLMTSLPLAQGHGRLLEPPSRSSMWRFGYPTPHNYDDNALNCGGLNTQWYVYHGKCGVCGDPWDQPQPRDNEAGGRFGRGIITRTYTEGQVISVRVQITANHRGWFEFRLCEHNSPSTPITHECLDRHVLELADGSGTRYPIDPHAQMVELKVKLPMGVRCSQCVLQWKWHGGNNFGDVQEEFYGCSDVAIGATSAATTNAKPPSTALPTTTPPVPGTTRPPTAGPTQLVTRSTRPHHAATTQAGSGTCHAVGQFAGVPDLDLYCREQCSRGNCPAYYCVCPSLPARSSSRPATPPSPATVTPFHATSASHRRPTQPAPSSTRGPGTTSSAGLASMCHATGLWQGVPELDLYCREQCPLGNCPPQCSCGPTQPASTKTPTPHVPTSQPPQPPTTTPPAPTSTSANGSVVCHGVGAWQGVPELDLYCRQNCPLGACPPLCSCSPASTPRLSTTATSPSSSSSSSFPLPVTAAGCVAVGSWQGDVSKDRWCRANCPLGLCPSLTCRCDPAVVTATPSVGTTTVGTGSLTAGTANPCRAVGPWAGDPLLDGWCKQTCAQYAGCDPHYCRCDAPGTGASGPLTTITPVPATTTTAARVHCRAINGWAGNPDLDRYCQTECSSGGACPPEYCSCTKGATTTTPSATTTAASSACYAINGWAGNPDLDRYCDVECKAGLCPPQYCACGPSTPAAITTTVAGGGSGTTLPSSRCRAIGTGHGVPEMDAWCRAECARGNCPPVYCAC